MFCCCCRFNLEDEAIQMKESSSCHKIRRSQEVLLCMYQTLKIRPVLGYPIQNLFSCWFRRAAEPFWVKHWGGQCLLITEIFWNFLNWASYLVNFKILRQAPRTKSWYSTHWCWEYSRLALAVKCSNSWHFYSHPCILQLQLFLVDVVIYT